MHVSQSFETREEVLEQWYKISLGKLYEDIIITMESTKATLFASMDDIVLVNKENPYMEIGHFMYVY